MSDKSKKTGKKSNTTDVEKGKRLKECRKNKNFYQADLAEKCNFSSAKYISMFECGDRSITWNQAYTFADVLGVNPAYIMCESDIMEFMPVFTDVGNDKMTYSVMSFFECLNIDIIFYVKRLWKSENSLVPVCLNQLYNFDLFNPCPKYCDCECDGVRFECEIISVSINKCEPFSFLLFVFLVKQIISDTKTRFLSDVISRTEKAIAWYVGENVEDIFTNDI